MQIGGQQTLIIKTDLEFRFLWAKTLPADSIISHFTVAPNDQYLFVKQVDESKTLFQLKGLNGVLD